MIIRLLHLFNIIINKLIVTLSSSFFKFKLILRKCHYGENIKINGNVFIATQTHGVIEIGDNFRLNSNPSSNLVGITNRAVFQSIGAGKIIIGNNCGFSSTVFSARKLIKLGNNVKIGGNTRIFDHDFHSTNFLDRRKKTQEQTVKSKEVTIGDDVFIGTNCIILKGVKIGDRSIIGAGSVVFALDIPRDSLVIGNPAKVVKRLNAQ